MMKKNIKIKGMHCSSCAMLIEDGLSEIAGVVEVKVSYEKGCADVSFDEKKTSTEDIKKAIKKEGYSVA